MRYSVLPMGGKALSIDRDNLLASEAADEALTPSKEIERSIRVLGRVPNGGSRQWNSRGRRDTHRRQHRGNRRQHPRLGSGATFCLWAEHTSLAARSGGEGTRPIEY